MYFVLTFKIFKTIHGYTLEILHIQLRASYSLKHIYSFNRWDFMYRACFFKT